MTDSFVDTDIIVRLITGDDAVKQTAARALFRRVRDGVETLRAPVTVIADAEYVLSSKRLYACPRTQVRDDLVALVRLPNSRIQNRRLVLRALDIVAATNLDFGDAMTVAAMERRGIRDLYAYGRDFDRFSGIHRKAP
ncbi:MAG TPA: PIN domain-containing protein [Dehalococcoidia bacterium]|jgi:predicted nucleic acid-binding protein|nr:PIN domain-containing protein [Dehalococcoidia bacterium]